MTHDSTRAVSLDRPAVAALEEAANVLLRLPEVAERYDEDEFWSLMASLVGTLPMDGTRQQIEHRLARALEPPDSLVVLPLANVAPLTTPIKLGSLIVGPFDQTLADRLRAQAGDARPKAAAEDPWWASPNPHGEQHPMTVANQCRTQLARALRDTEQAFDDVIAIALALEPDLDGRSLYSLRGETHRPGTRGLVLDRAAIARAGAGFPQIHGNSARPASLAVSLARY